MTATTKEARLFTLRLWHGEMGDAQIAWRSKVQALPESEAYYFRDWPGLIRHLTAMLEACHQAPAGQKIQNGGTP